jgi:predicted RNA-binding Zn ribbon-like protein
MIKNADEYLEQGFGKEYAWIDFVNSQEWDGFGKPQEHLGDAWLTLFLRRWNLGQRIPSRRPPADLVRLRDNLRHAAEALSTGQPPGREELATLNSWLDVAARQKLVEHQQGWRLELEPLEQGWPWIVSRIAASFAEMLERGDSRRLKICPNNGCRWIFYDRTKGRTRRWCSDRSCGNRDRVRRARAASRGVTR